MLINGRSSFAKSRSVFSFLNSMLLGRRARLRRRRRVPAVSAGVEALERRTLLSTSTLLLSSDSGPVDETDENNDDPAGSVPGKGEEGGETDDGGNTGGGDDPDGGSDGGTDDGGGSDGGTDGGTDDGTDGGTDDGGTDDGTDDGGGDDGTDGGFSGDTFAAALEAFNGSDPNGRSGPFKDLGFDLSLLYYEYQAHGAQFATDPEYLYLQSLLRNEQIVTQDGSVLISVTASAGAQNPDQDLADLGATEADGGNVWLPIDSLDELAKLSWVEDVTVSYQSLGNVRHVMSPRVFPDDPLFFDQWHLDNRSQTGGLSGEDANVLDAWDDYRGTGVTIGIVDTGIHHTHPDLVNNYDASLSFDFIDFDFDPTPLFDDHGTSVAGVAAADGFNFQGVSGAAPDATLAGLRLIEGLLTDQLEAGALSWKPQDIDVYNNSWGPIDIGVIADSGPMVKGALQRGVLNGRGGLGNIYVWAGGNGQFLFDNVNYDGYANSRFTIAVGAIDHNGLQAFYSEPGAALLVTTHSQGGRLIPPDGIVTTAAPGTGDFPGEPEYTNSFGGTSSSAPLVSGVIALMLEANPTLSWRDVQHILVNTARRNHSFDPEWTQNGAGRWVNHKYGFGAIDAKAAVNLAEVWTNVDDEVSVASREIEVDLPLEDALLNRTDIESSHTFDSNHDISVETVEVVFNATAEFRGDLSVKLVSPDGTVSILAEPRLTDPGLDYNSWTFMTTRHWGERSAGTWRLQVADEIPLLTSTFNSWQITAYGTGEVPPEPPPGWTEDLTASSVSLSGLNLSISDGRMGANQVATLALPAENEAGETLSYSAELLGGDPVAEAAYALDQTYDFQLIPGSEENNYWLGARGAGEKYLAGFFILPNGEVYKWGGSLAASRLIGTLDGRYHDDPGLLVDVLPPAMPDVDLSLNDSKLVVTPGVDFTGEFAVSVTVTDGTDSSTEAFSVAVINTAPVLSPIGSQTLPRGETLEHQLSAADSNGDNLTFSVTLHGVDPVAGLAYDLDRRYDFQLIAGWKENNYWHNARGRGEKYLAGFFILPDGQLYKWGSSIAASTLVGTLDKRYHDDPGLLVDAVDPAHALNPAYALDRDHDFQLIAGSEANNYWFNARGAHEKYLAGFFILPNGDVYKWGGSIAASRLIGTVDTRYYDDPSLLVDVPVPSGPDVEVSIVGSKLVITPAVTFTGSFELTVTVSDGSESDSETITVKVADDSALASTSLDGAFLDLNVMEL